MPQSGGLRSRLAAGDVFLGIFIGLKEPALVEIVGETGYDFVVIDLEHTTIDVADAETLVRAAESAGLYAFIRVARADWRTAARVIEMGVAGVMAPHINRPEEAKGLVDAIKYPPIGNRGLNVTTRAAHYGAVSPQDHVAQANEETLAIVLVEDREGIERIDDILSVPGVDVAITGPADLSRSYGVAGDIRNQVVEKAIATFMESARRNNVFIMRSCFSLEDVTTNVRNGASLVTSPLSDSHFFASSLRTAHGVALEHVERGLADRG
jgi:2-keto-3-deoxy-L-rhamnonate aldolase RhmA